MSPDRLFFLRTSDCGGFWFECGLHSCLTSAAMRLRFLLGRKDCGVSPCASSLLAQHTAIVWEQKPTCQKWGQEQWGGSVVTFRSPFTTLSNLWGGQMPVHQHFSGVDQQKLTFAVTSVSPFCGKTHPSPRTFSHRSMRSWVGFSWKAALSPNTVTLLKYVASGVSVRQLGLHRSFLAFARVSGHCGKCSCKFRLRCTGPTNFWCTNSAIWLSVMNMN